MFSPLIAICACSAAVPTLTTVTISAGPVVPLPTDEAKWSVVVVVVRLASAAKALAIASAEVPVHIILTQGSGACGVTLGSHTLPQLPVNKVIGKQRKLTPPIEPSLFDLVHGHVMKAASISPWADFKNCADGPEQ